MSPYAVDEPRTLTVPAVAGGFLQLKAIPAEPGSSPGDLFALASLATPDERLGTRLHLSRDDQLSLLWFLDSPPRITGGYPQRSRWASPCGALRLALTVALDEQRRKTAVLGVDLTAQWRDGPHHLHADLVLKIGTPSREEVAAFLPGAGEDDLDLVNPEGAHVNALAALLDRWPCRRMVERDGALLEPVALRLYRRVSEEELTAYLERRVAEAGGEPDPSRERAFAHELLAFQAARR